MREERGIGSSNGQLNSRGFTLIEVIIAVVIMAIASIPLMHAFSTTANTSSKALVKMRATNAAENIMENIKGMSLEEVVKTYGGVDGSGNPLVAAPNYDGLNTPANNPGSSDLYVSRKDESGNTVMAGYRFELTASDADRYNKDINKVLDSGYKATIEIDPTYYPNVNSLNLSDFDEMSATHSAIVAVGESLDDEALDKFADLAGNLAVDNVYAQMSVNDRKAKFAKIYKREIRIDVTDRGTGTDADGNEIQLAEVKATVSYLLPDNANQGGATQQYVPTGTSTQKLLNRKVFSNVSNNQKFNSVFILYDPIYDNAKDSRDIIIIHNRDGVPFNLYIVAQDAAGDARFDAYRKQATGGLILEIYESKDSDGNEPVTLYTNLHDAVDYTRTESSELIPVQCYINLAAPAQDPEGLNDSFNDTVYKRVKNKRGTWENTNAVKALHTRDIDGKYLDASQVGDKIYDVRVTVEKETTSEEDWPISVTLTGTLVDE